MREKTKSRKYFSYQLQNLEPVEHFLEEKAKEGWIVYKHIGGWFFFQKGKPQKLKYYVEVFEKERWNNSYQNVVNQEFIKTYQKKGWKFIDADSRFQIMQCENPSAKRPTIMAVDKVKSIYKSCYKEQFYILLCLLFMALFNMFFSFTGIVKMLSSLSQLLYVSAWAVLAIYLVGYMMSQRIWYRKALMTEGNEVLRNPRHKYLYIGLICAIVILVLSIVGFFIESHTYSSGEAFTRCLILLAVITLYGISVVVRDYKKSWKSGVAACFIAILLCGGVYGIAYHSTSIFKEVHTTKAYQSTVIYDDTLPITLDSLNIAKDASVEYTNYHAVYGEFLIKEDYYSEEPADPSMEQEPAVCYLVYRTSSAYLKDQIITKECFEKNSKDSYELLTDETQEAMAVYKKKLETGFYEYIFEFENEIIKMNINRELSKEQMQKIQAI